MHRNIKNTKRLFFFFKNTEFRVTIFMEEFLYCRGYLNMIKKIFSTALLIFSAVTILSARPVPRPHPSRCRPAPVRSLGPEFLVPGLIFGGLAIGTAIIATAAAEAEEKSRREAVAQARAAQVQVQPVYTATPQYAQAANPSVVVVTTPSQAEQPAYTSAPVTVATTDRNFVTKITVLKADGRTVYYDSVFKRPVRYAGDIVFLSTVAVDDVQLSYNAIQNVSYTPYR
jgi:hypothetical protein